MAKPEDIYEMIGPPKDQAKLLRGAEQEQSREETPQIRPSLKDLVPNAPEFYEALEYFLLGDPERQISQLGEPDSLLTKGDTARAAGDNLHARVEYESAAKIAIYEQNKEAAKKFLVLAEEVSDNEKYSGFHRTLLKDIDQVVRIAKAYYGQ